MILNVSHAFVQILMINNSLLVCQEVTVKCEYIGKTTI